MLDLIRRESGFSWRSFLARTPVRHLLLSIAALSASWGCTADAPQTARSVAPATIIELSYDIVKRIPHRQHAFTQGLLWHQDQLWESSGQYGKSTLAVLNPSTGKVTREVALPSKIFAEGIAVHGSSLLQLSWRAERAFRYDLTTLKKLGEFHYSGQGWGLSHNQQQFIMSNGSATLQFRDTQDFTLQQTRTVTYAGQPLKALNELEWIDGLVLANVWQRNAIVVIDPGNRRAAKAGQAMPVIARLDLSKLKRFETSGADVLNGIAWQADEQLLWVTGKYWRNLYALKITPGFEQLHGAGEAATKLGKTPLEPLSQSE